MKRKSEGSKSPSLTTNKLDSKVTPVRKGRIPESPLPKTSPKTEFYPKVNDLTTQKAINKVQSDIYQLRKAIDQPSNIAPLNIPNVELINEVASTFPPNIKPPCQATGFTNPKSTPTTLTRVNIILARQEFVYISGGR